MVVRSFTHEDRLDLILTVVAYTAKLQAPHDNVVCETADSTQEVFDDGEPARTNRSVDMEKRCGI